MPTWITCIGGVGRRLLLRCCNCFVKGVVANIMKAWRTWRCNGWRCNVAPNGDVSTILKLQRMKMSRPSPDLVGHHLKKKGCCCCEVLLLFKSSNLDLVKLKALLSPYLNTYVVFITCHTETCSTLPSYMHIEACSVVAFIACHTRIMSCCHYRLDQLRQQVKDATDLRVWPSTNLGTIDSERWLR